jgi:hypothetical protein
MYAREGGHHVIGGDCGDVEAEYVNKDKRTGEEEPWQQQQHGRAGAGAVQIRGRVGELRSRGEDLRWVVTCGRVLRRFGKCGGGAEVRTGSTLGVFGRARFGRSRAGATERNRWLKNWRSRI